MKASVLKRRLAELIDKHGDLDVVFDLPGHQYASDCELVNGVRRVTREYDRAGDGSRPFAYQFTFALRSKPSRGGQPWDNRRVEG